MKSTFISFALSTLSLTSTAWAAEQERGFYPFGFGGLEKIEVDSAVNILMKHEYSGVLPEVGGRTQDDLKRLSQYLDRSEKEGDPFKLMGVYTNHKIFKEGHGYDDSFQKQIIDTLASRGGGRLWVAVRAVQNQNDPVNYPKVDQFIKGIFEYAMEGQNNGKSKNVDIIFYPHVNNAYESTIEAMPLVEEINNPRFKVAINLIHEYHAGRADSTSLAETFELAKGHIGAVLIGGIQTGSDFSILSLEESQYDLKPFMSILNKSDFKEPVGFINFEIPDVQSGALVYPESYLKNSIDEWSVLCTEADINDDEITSIKNKKRTTAMSANKFNASGQLLSILPNTILGVYSK